MRFLSIPKNPSYTLIVIIGKLFRNKIKIGIIHNFSQINARSIHEIIGVLCNSLMIGTRKALKPLLSATPIPTGIPIAKENTSPMATLESEFHIIIYVSFALKIIKSVFSTILGLGRIMGSLKNASNSHKAIKIKNIKILLLIKISSRNFTHSVGIYTF